MNEILSLIMAFAIGISLGVIFFGGLWWTVQKVNKFKHPALWFLCSFLLRTALVILGFYLIGKGHWERMILCLLGFILARIIVNRLVQLRERKQTYSVKEGSHEPQS
jgi:F1F0 ATPase subunit 2